MRIAKNAADRGSSHCLQHFILLLFLTAGLLYQSPTTLI